MTETLDVNRLRLLREVQLRGSIAAAARVVGLSASAVSQQLAQLERETGTALLDRSPQGVRLTGAGHVLADHARGVLDLLAEAQADLDRLGDEVAGPVTIAAVASAAATVVSAAATRLRADHPGIALNVIAAEPARTHALLAAGDADIGVVDEYDYVPLARADNVTAEELVQDRLVVVAGPALPGRGAVRLADLAEADWVMPPVDAACGLAVRCACRALGFEPRVRWETDDMALLARAVADGHGIAVLPRRAIAGDEVVLRPLRDPVLT
ncbi:MAG: LysR family transcriptional regulator, partial [Actinobacteria bacterium]|nr:LysR family transcriptional regulator [Actinomycetota bacterium]